MASPAMAAPVLWQPNPGQQKRFLACPVREILYGGAKGGGKTAAIGPKALKHVQQHGQWATVLILRETYPQLTEIMERMRPLCLAQGATYNKVEKTWRFPSGARIIFGHLGNGADPYWGQEYSMIIVDEVTRTIKTEADYLKLLGSLRSSHGVPCSVVLTSNPGGQGHNWVKARFMSVPPMTVQRDERSGLERVFIPATLSDNPKLPAEYRHQLEQMGDAERRAFLEGDWSAFEGAVFKLDPGVHVWTWAQFKERTGHDRIPAEWNRFRTMDWGSARPFAIYWYAQDFKGRTYVYREWYGVAHDRQGNPIPNQGVGMLPEEVAKGIKKIEAEGLVLADGKRAPERILAAWTGPDLFQAGRRDQGGRAINEAFAAEGVHWTAWAAGEGSRIAGKTALHQRLNLKAMEDGPALVFIAEETPHAQRTLPALEYDRHNPEDVDSTGDDHGYDSLRGYCIMRPWQPVEAKSPDDSFIEKLKAKRNGGGTWMSS